jgi:hypothetical protein
LLKKPRCASGDGTFLSSLDVGLGAAMRCIADIRQRLWIYTHARAELFRCVSRIRSLDAMEAGTVKVGQLARVVRSFGISPVRPAASKAR